MKRCIALLTFSIFVPATQSCRKPDPAPAQLSAHHAKVVDAVEDVYIWGALGSLDRTPENQVIEAVTKKVRTRTVTRADLQAAYEAQVAKRKYLSDLFEKQDVLRQAANEQSRLAQSVRDAEVRRAAMRVAKNAQDFLAASETWRKLQTRKGEWNEALFQALRDQTSAPNREIADQLNRELKETVAAIERIRSERETIFSEYQGVVTRRAAT